MRTIHGWIRSAFSAVAGLALVGCAAVPPLIGGPPPPDPPTGAPMCRNSTERLSSSKRPGPAPDTVEVNGHRLYFPGGQTTPGNAPFQIAELAADYVVVRAEPSGHRFTGGKGQLTISYARCPSTVTGPFAIYRRNGNTWDKLPNYRPGPGPREVTVPLDSLSEYALGGP